MYTSLKFWHLYYDESKKTSNFEWHVNIISNHVHHRLSDYNYSYYKGLKSFECKALGFLTKAIYFEFHYTLTLALLTMLSGVISQLIKNERQ
ncbi:hypothetical protein T11_5391 [Trichinella zimbabwensis]|uniref:Uncharacterized protein n=1 Tax=Trichinella zimbabwensis TaxID=268475 RepID=A0A0V1I0M9_9BILA|nr:hypothetical protein T11_5391 [Trichinella zimbabwensis]